MRLKRIMLWYVVAGIAGGLIGGMGMGGGTLLIPILTLLLSVGQLEAQAINLIVFIPMAIVTLFIHIKNKLVDIKKLLYSLPLAIALAVVGALLVKKIDESILKTTFGVFMLIVGVVFLAKSLLMTMIDKLTDHKMIS